MTTTIVDLFIASVWLGGWFGGAIANWENDRLVTSIVVGLLLVTWPAILGYKLVRMPIGQN